MQFIVNRFKEKQFFGHPAGLFVLLLAEKWERMFYYDMRALLVLYMVTNLFVDSECVNNALGLNEFHSILESGFGPLES